jgi:hypothetical protein
VGTISCIFRTRKKQQYINIIQKGGKNEITGAKILTVIWKVEKALL